MKTNILWKLYFWLLVFALLALNGAAVKRGFSMRDAIDVPISLTGLAGVFGFAYQKSIFVSIFWRAFLPVIFVWDIFANFFWGDISDMQDFTWLETAAVIVVFYIVFLPGYVALYSYGFRSQKVWSRTGRAV